MTTDGFSYVQVVDSSLIEEASVDFSTYSNQMGVVPKGPAPEGEQVLEYVDPPDHGIHRKLVARAFSVAQVNDKKVRMHEVADQLVDEIAERGNTFDVRTDFARQLPSQIVSEILGIPPSDRAYFIALTERSEALVGKPEETEAWKANNREFMEYVLAEFDKRAKDPQDDLLTSILRAEEDGQRFTRIEAAALVRLILGAGNGTTSIAISNTIYLLETNPEQKALFLSDIQRFAGPAIEEGLRFDCPVQGTFRGVKHDTTLGGEKLAAGDRIFMLYSAANHDPERYPDSDEFLIDRDWKSLPAHLAFGKGIHYCIGAALARAESTIGLETLYRRLPNLRLQDGFVAEQLPGMVFRTWSSLPMTFDPPAAKARDRQ